MNAFRTTRLYFLFLPLLATASAALDDGGWTYPTGETIFGTPALEGKSVLYIPTEGIEGTTAGSLHALRVDGASPSLLWSHASTDWIDSAPAIADDGTVYVGSWNGMLTALDPDTGAEIWSYDTENIIIASPAVAPDGAVLFPAYDGFLYALNPDGTLRWATFIGAEMDSSPSLGSDGTAFVGTYAGTLHAIAPNGTEKWSFTADVVTGEDSRILSSPAITLDGQVIFGSGNGYVYALSAATGELVWKTRFPQEMDSSPVLDAEDNIYLGSRVGWLYKLDSIGIEQWSVEVGEVYFSSPVIDAKGRVYIVSFSGDNTSTLWCYGPDGEAVDSVTFPGIVDASPVITPDGRILVCTLGGDVLSFNAGFGLNPDGWPKFGYNLANQNDPSRPTTPGGLLALFPDWTDLGSDWTHVWWLETFYSASLPWIYHYQFGWLYAGGPGISEHWLFQPALGWLWTRPDTFPYAWSAGIGDWVFLAADAGGQPWYYDFSSSSWKMLQP